MKKRNNALLADWQMHFALNEDQVGSIPTRRTKKTNNERGHHELVDKKNNRWIKKCHSGR